MPETNGWRHDIALSALLESDGFQSFDLAAALRVIVETGAEALEAARCSLWQPSAAGQPAALTCIALYDEASGGYSVGPAMFEADDPETFFQLNRPHPKCFYRGEGGALPPALERFMESHGFSALMQWPVVAEGRLKAILAFADRTPGRRWSEEDRAFARILAGLIGLSIRGDALRRSRLAAVCAADMPIITPRRPASEEAPLQNGTRPSQTILLVDADTAAHELLGEALNRAAYRLIHAFDQHQGFNLAADILPDVIVVNVLSPSLDGWGLLARLKNHEVLRHIPVIILTLSGEDEAGYLLRASDFLTKPFRFEMLLETINRHRPAEGPAQVLVVEDEEVTRSVLMRLLERDGWVVETVGNGYEGLRCLERFKPSVVLLDLMMPGMDGFEFIRMLRMTEQPGKHLPLVVVTAKDLSEEERNWLTGTTRSFAQRDAVTRAELVETIRDWVSHATARRTVVF